MAAGSVLPLRSKHLRPPEYNATEKPQLHKGIKCLTCKKLLSSKRECKYHMGHEVVYLDDNGEPER